MRWWGRRDVVAPREEGIVIVIDDEDFAHRQVAEAYADLPWRIVGARTPAEARQVLASAESSAVLLIIVDLYLGGGDAFGGFAILEEARHAFPKSLTAALSGTQDFAIINRVGAIGAFFISKHERLQETLREYANRAVVARSMTDETLEDIVEEFVNHGHLTPRESEIVALVAQDVPRRLIVERLGISTSTFKKHVSHIMSKTDVRSVKALVEDLKAKARRA